jgi:DNA repair photolyase
VLARRCPVSGAHGGGGSRGGAGGATGGAGAPDQQPPGLRVLKGRGATDNPANRFERLHVVATETWTDPDDPAPSTILLRDASRTILARNQSPDVGFEFSVNPYRGCEHGCIYCYARPTHEYLGFSAGLDFETRILVKEDAPALLRAALLSPRWTPRPIAMSGVTDPYQPVERRLRLTRGCLEVLAEFRNPVTIVTKNHLVTRDVDLLAEMASYQAAAVAVSVTSLRPEIQRILEPRTATPARRLDAIRRLSAAGVPVRVMIAPVIPGLTDEEIPAILEAAAEAGAGTASYIVLRLPHGVKELFADWLEAHFPDRRARVLNRVREMRGGRLYDAAFGTRMRGEGVYADQLRQLFELSRRRHGLDGAGIRLSTDAFRRPSPGGQLGLFDGVSRDDG